MSAEYSHYERDQFRRPNRRSEYRTTFTYAQRVYEPKSSDKNSKNQDQHQDNSSKNYCDYDNYENHDNYDRYNSNNDRYNNYSSRDNRNNNHGSYRQKGNQRERRDGNYRIGYWIKEAVPVVKENKETVKDKKDATPDTSKEVEKHVSDKLEVTKKEKEGRRSDAEDKKLNHMSSGGSAISGSSNSTDVSETKKAENLFDSPEKKSDSLQTVEEKETSGSDDETKSRNSSKKAKVTKKGKKNEDKNQAEKTEVKEDVFEDKKVKQNQENKEGEEKESVETDESDRENYSNIDEMVEKKLMSNGLEDLVFDDFGNEIKKEDLNAIISDERPVWEDIDTKKVLEDIQNEEYLFMLPQDIKSWANKEWDNITNNQNEKNMPNKESENLMKFCFKEDDDEEYDRIFSVRKFDRGFSRPKVDIAPVPPMSNNSYRNHCDTATVNNNPVPFEDIDSGLLGPKSANLPVFRSQYMQTPFTPHDAQIQSSRVPQGKSLHADIPRSSTVQNVENFSHVDPPKYLFKRFSPDYDSPIWFYIDAFEIIQGPFSGRVMDDWLVRRCLPLDLRVSMGNSANFNRLNELAEIYTQELRQNYNEGASPNSRPQNSSFSPQERPRFPSFHNQQAYPTMNMQRRSPLSSQCMTDLYIPFESLPNQCQPLVKENSSSEELESPVLDAISFLREDSRPRGLNVSRKASTKPNLDENYNPNNMESYYQETIQKCSPLAVRNNNFLYNNSPVNNAFVPIIPKRNSPQNSTAIYASAPDTPFGNMMGAMKHIQPFTPTYKIQPTNCVPLNQLQDFAWKAVISDDDMLETGEVSRTQ